MLTHYRSHSVAFPAIPPSRRVGLWQGGPDSFAKSYSVWSVTPVTIGQVYILSGSDNLKRFTSRNLKYILITKLELSATPNTLFGKGIRLHTWWMIHRVWFIGGNTKPVWAPAQNFLCKLSVGLEMRYSLSHFLTVCCYFSLLKIQSLEKSNSALIW